MKLHPNEQRILKYILETEGTTHAELKEHFLPMLPTLVDFYLVRLMQEGFIGEVIEGKIRATELAQKIQNRLPEVPVHELIIPMFDYRNERDAVFGQ